MIDARGKLIYVGKSKSLRNRLLTYLQAEPADPKAGRIIQSTERLIWESAPHELPALVRELELIRRWRPEYNVRGQPGLFRRVYLCLDRGPAPQAYLAPQPTERARQVFGPLPSKEILRDAVRYVNTWFHLRDCPQRVPMIFADQLELFSVDRKPQCSRFELGTCPAPCAAGCTKQAYAKNLSQARAFLCGLDTSLLDQLEHDMLDSAENQHFERAANLRDVWMPLEWLHRHLESLRSGRHNSCFVFPARTPSGREYWLVIRQGHVADIVYPPRDQETARRTLRHLHNIFSPVTDNQTPSPCEDLEHMLLVLSWFRANAIARDSAIAPPQAIEQCERLLTGDLRAVG